MAQFLVETYASRADGAAVKRAAEQARLAAEILHDEGVDVRFVRWLFVPDDETCFFLYDAATADAVREAAERAHLHFNHISEAVTDGQLPSGELEAGG